MENAKSMWREIISGIFHGNHNTPGKKINKKRDGHWKEFSQHGILLKEGDYRDGLKTGKWKLYYDTGELAIEETYYEGKREGLFQSFYHSGQPISEGQYRDGKREGRFNVFDNSGKLVKTMLFKDDVLIDEEVFEKEANRVLQEEQMK